MQHPVPRLVPVAVIDLLEMVDVSRDDRHWKPAHGGAFHPLRELVGHVAPVVEPCQLIDDGELEPPVDAAPQDFHIAGALGLRRDPRQ